MIDHEDIELVRALYRAVEASDHEGILRCVADDLRWRQAGSAVPAAGQDTIGADALLDRVIRPLEEHWDGFTEEIDRIDGRGGLVVATGTYRGVHRRSGRALEAEFCHLWEVRDGSIRTFRQYTDTAAFARATA